MKFRKILSYLVLAVGIFLAVLFGCKNQSVPEGVEVLKGVGKGFGGDIKVEVHLKDDAIVDVKITEHSETEGISNVAREEMPKRIVENQSYNVDTVSGATYSSNGIKDAVKDALKAKGYNYKTKDNTIIDNDNKQASKKYDYFENKPYNLDYQ